MKPSMVLGHAYSLSAAAALMAGCGGSQPTLGYPTAMSRTPAMVRHSTVRGRSNPATLIYISDLLLNEVYVNNYPDGGHLVTLTGFSNPAGLCSDTDGNVFVMGNRDDDVIEYAHGESTPTQTLGVPGWAEACAYDPNTSNLAVVFDSYSYGTGVAVFAGEQGTPTTYYSGPGTVVWHCGYDNNSNLFCDGQTESVRAAFFALGKGSNEIQQAPVTGGEFYELSQIQWDGTYMAVVDMSFDTVSRIQFADRTGFSGKVTGWGGSVVGSTTLNRCGYEEAYQSWIYDGSIIVPCTRDSPYQNKDKGRVFIYNYARGGNPVQRIAQWLVPPDFPNGVTISVAPTKSHIHR